MPPHREPYDFVAIGLGPFNLGLACLTEPIAELDGAFLEQKPEFDWHPGMLLPGTTLQTPFLADLVTLADPTSRFSFLNYLKENGRLYPFYIRESFFPLRAEYVDYCRWAAGRLSSVHFGHQVTSVEYDEPSGQYLVHAGQRTLRARHLVLGTGTVPYVPESCAGLGGAVVHSSRYRQHRDRLLDLGSITVVGSGQSAAEIYHDLLRESPNRGYRLDWITRSPRFFPLEYTKLTLEMTSPEYTDYFHALPEPTRDRLLDNQKGLYKGINTALINDIFDLLYELDLDGPARPRLLTNTAVRGADHDPATGTITLALRQIEQGTDFSHETAGLVLATGYRYREPDFLAPVADRIERDSAGRFAVRRDYTIDRNHGEIFVQNAEAHTHGIVAPDLGMAAYRNSRIIERLLGRAPYPVEKSIAFQRFGAPEAVRR